MVFFVVLYLKTSFLVYICILGQIKRKIFFLDFFDFFGGHFGKKLVKYARARSHIRNAFNFFPIAQFFGMMNHYHIIQDAFFYFFDKIKIDHFRTLLKWRDYFSLFFLTFFDFQPRLEDSILFFSKKQKNASQIIS